MVALPQKDGRCKDLWLSLEFPLVCKVTPIASSTMNCVCGERHDKDKFWMMSIYVAPLSKWCEFGRVVWVDAAQTCQFVTTPLGTAIPENFVRVVLIAMWKINKSKGEMNVDLLHIHKVKDYG